MITKCVTGAKLQAVEATTEVVAEQSIKQAQVLNEFSKVLQDERLKDYPLLEIPEKDQEGIRNKLNEGQQANYLFGQKVGTYRPGQMYRTDWGVIVHIDQVQYYSRPEELPWSTQLSDEEKAEYRVKAPEGFDYVHFSKLG